MNLLLIHLAPLLMSWAASLHPVHVSVSEVHYNRQTQSLEIMHKVFIDDFENALEKYYNGNLGLGTEKEASEADALIEAYLQKHFAIWVDGKPLAPGYLGREADLEAVWIYQEITGVDKAEAFKITNTLLFDLFDDQRNILHLEYLEKKVSFLFRHGQGTDDVQLSGS